jgi:hypothetical protein
MQHHVYNDLWPNCYHFLFDLQLCYLLYSVIRVNMIRNIPLQCINVLVGVTYQAKRVRQLMTHATNQLQMAQDQPI